MTTPHAKTAEEVAKMVTFIPSSISGIASIVIGPHNEAIQGYELRPITAGDTFAEKAAKEIQEWFAAAIRDARTDGGKELASALSDMGVEICWAEPCHPTRAHVKVKSGHLLDDAGNVRREVEQPKIIGEHPRTADGVRFAMGAWLYAKVDGKVIECGPLMIEDPDTMHFEDYPEGQRWNIRVRDTDGCEHDLHEGDLYASKEALTAKDAQGAKHE